jgi:hypothetical protein
MSYNVVKLSDLETIPVGKHGLRWRPIRSRLGIEAFGINAYTSAEVGGEVVEAHTEESLGHEEVYVVVSGRATFTLDGEELDAPAGTIVHLPEPSVRRSAVAAEPGTTVLAVGAKPGEAFRPSAWEAAFRAAQLPPEEAVKVLEAEVRARPDEAPLHYNLACFRALSGDREGAVASFRRAHELDPEKSREWAAGDSDLDSIRDEVSAIAG